MTAPIPAPKTAPAQERLTAIDGLRGFAVLGILMMNIQSFSMVWGAYTNPALHMDLEGINLAVWAIGHVLFDQKFMAIFSLLFGASLVLMTQKQTDAGVPAWPLFYRRQFWLMGIGLVHAYLIWYGDVLLLYALTGMIVFWLRRLSARILLSLGLALVTIPPLLFLASWWLIGLLPVAEASDIIREFEPSLAQIYAEINAYRGTWGQGLAQRIETALEFHLLGFPMSAFWRTAGPMLIGMALFKWGIITGKAAPQTYTRLALFGVLIGLPLTMASAWMGWAVEWDPFLMFLGPGHVLNYGGSLALAVAYLGLIMRLFQTNWLQRLQARLAAVGRMALSAYLFQSLLCTLIFYGHGLGAFGLVERWGQVLIVLAIWVFTLLIAPLWLARFRFGPLEWAWRCLSYGRWQRFRI